MSSPGARGNNQAPPSSSKTKGKMNEQNQQNPADNAYLRQILQGEASRQNEARRAAGLPALPPSVGGSSVGLRPSLMGQHGRLLGGAAAIPPALRASQSLDLTRMHPSLRTTQSLALEPSPFNRTRSLEFAAARRAAGLASPTYPSFYDQQSLLMAQQQQQRGHFASSSAFFGANVAALPSNPATWRNLPNEGATAQGLELLRAASLSLPNRPGFGPTTASSSPRMAATMGQSMGGVAQSEAQAHRRNEGDDSDEEEAGRTNKVFIPELRDLDILCGRGGKSNHHFGNKRYRQVVSEMKAMYRSTEAKTVKTDLSRAIVDHVCSYGGRFVRKDEKTGRYYLLSKAEARKKTSQALRETKALKWTM